MELVCNTEFKRMSPKKGFIAPYIRFRWNQDSALIGKPVSVYKVDGGYFLSTESNQFKPLNLKKVESDITQIKNQEFKPKKNENKTPQESETSGKTGLKGFEPLTCGLRVRRYAELSYRPMPC